MTDDPIERGGLTLNAVATIIAVVLSLASMIYATGIQSAQIGENRRRIETLETKNDRRDEMIQRIDTRTAAIEAKLQILLPDRPLEIAR